VERLLGRMRHFAMRSPGIETVVDDEARKMGERRVGGADCSAISGRPRQQLACGLHRGSFGERRFVPLDQHPPPGIDLLVNVDLDRADIAAAAIERRGEG